MVRKELGESRATHLALIVTRLVVAESVFHFFSVSNSVNKQTP